MNVLVPMDGSEQSEAALDHALTRFEDPVVTVLSVVDPVATGYEVAPGAGPAATGVENWYEQAEMRAERIVTAAEDRVAETDADATVETATEIGDPARTIVAYADEHDVDHVVVGSHGRTGLTRVLLGSVAESVVRRADCPVTVVR
ncbi:MAG: universal stress protein [Halolamina sp.]